MPLSPLLSLVSPANQFVTTATERGPRLSELDGSYTLESGSGIYQEFEKPVAFFGTLIPHRRVTTVSDGEVRYDFPTFAGWMNPDTRVTVDSADEMVEAWESGIDGLGNIRAWAVVPREFGLVALDIDQHGGNGFQALRELAGRAGVAVDLTWYTDHPNHPCYEVTPRGGLHLWFKWSGEGLPQDLLGKGLELLQDSCFVAGSKKYPDLPQTRLVGAYENIPEMPEFLLDLMAFRLEEDRAKAKSASVLPTSKAHVAPTSISSTSDVFDQARDRFPSRIEEFFRVPGACWKEDQYHTLNPLRLDRHIGSFSISRDGRWYDHATGEGGNGIDLVSRWKGITLLESALFILGKDERRDGNDTGAIDESNRGGGVHKELAKRRIRLVPIGQMKLEPPQWLIQDFVEASSLGMVYGKPESLKSFIALSWALCIASGKDWNGRKVCQGTVVYINAEGKEENFRMRAEAWCAYHEVNLQGLPILGINTAVSFDDRGDTSELIQEIEELGAMPKAIFVDTLARCFGNGDENSTKDMTKFIRVCDELKEHFGSSVVLVHHSGHGTTERARGSSALRASLDQEYTTDRDKKAGTVLLKCTKSKDGPPPPDTCFKLNEVQLRVDDVGKVLTGVLLVPTDQAPQVKHRRLGENERKALDVLTQLCREQESNTDEDDAASKAITPSIWSEVCRSTKVGLDANSFFKVKTSLIEKGYVIEDEWKGLTPKE